MAEKKPEKTNAVPGADQKQDVLIYLTSQQWAQGEQSPLTRLTTEGELLYEPDEERWVVTYDESEATGMAGTTTRIALEKDGSVSLSRRGSVRMDMHFSKGQNHIGQLETPYGLLHVSIMTNEASGTMSSTGGNIRLGYSLDFNKRDAVSLRLNLDVERRM